MKQNGNLTTGTRQFKSLKDGIWIWKPFIENLALPFNYFYKVMIYQEQESEFIGLALLLMKGSYFSSLPVVTGKYKKANLLRCFFHCSKKNIFSFHEFC